MPRFGEVLFSGSRFIFWALSPFLLLFAIATPLMVSTWTTTSILLTSGLDVAALLLILTLFDPKRFWWAGRSVTGIVFCAYLAYLVGEVRAGKPWVFGPRSDSSPLNALLGLVFIGLPCLRYTLLGRFGSDQERTTKRITGDSLFSEPCPYCHTPLKNHDWTMLGCTMANAATKPQMTKFFDSVKAHEWQALHSFADWKSDQDNLEAYVVKCSFGGVVLVRWNPFELYDTDGLCGREHVTQAEMKEIETLVPANSWRPGPPFFVK